MHIQWPLVIFTLCICLISGIFGIQGYLAYKGKGSKIQLPALITSLVVLVIGGVASFMHLGHWERIFNGFGHLTSGITQELIGIVVIFVVMVIYFVKLRKDDGVVPRTLGLTALVVSILLVLVMAHSYTMAARPIWDSLMLYFYYLANAFLLGSIAIWLLSKAKEEHEVATSFVRLSLLALAVQVVAVIAYVVKIAVTWFPVVGNYFDPTRPTIAPNHPTNLLSTLIAGEAAPWFWLAALVIGIVIPLAVLLISKSRDAASKTAALLPALAFVCVVVGSIAWRAILYIFGFSVFMFY